MFAMMKKGWRKAAQFVRESCDKVTGVVLGTLVAGSAVAAVPAGVDTAFTAVGADAATVAGYAVPIVLSVLGLTLVIKLIKRFGNKI